jgi:hypothetical protein
MTTFFHKIKGEGHSIFSTVLFLLSEVPAKLANPVIPAKAGIQEGLKESGFPPSRE